MLKFPYQEAVRALMWTATMTRPDIGCAIRAVARFCEQCRGLNMKASTTRNVWSLGKRRLASGAVVTLAKGGG